MSSEYSPQALYLKYLENSNVTVDSGIAAHVETLIAKVNWDEPETAEDFQGTAVFALIEAEQAEDLETRRLYLDLALQALQAAIATNTPSLAPVQWAIVQTLLGNLSQSTQVAFNQLIGSAAFVGELEQPASQLVYLPKCGPWSSGAITAELLPELLNCNGIEAQRLLLSTEALCRSHLVLYNAGGGRALQVLAQQLPQASSTHRKLGVYQLANKELEGFLHLHWARSNETSKAEALRTITALQLAAQAYQSSMAANVWKRQAQVIQAEIEQTLPEWGAVAAHDVDCVYIPYDENICFAAEPTINSIVTRVLLAEGDWFEREMELWRRLIKPGMTVIDVGANSGVYTFSAAKRVGKTGKVIAIEPFQGCIFCLNQTCKVNGFDWVTVCAAAASDRVSQSFLTLHSASELNELSAAVDEAGQPINGQNVQAIDCITLDSLLEKECLEHVDFLKIDAEGHEVNVLRGAEKLLNKFQPVILYENIAGQSGSNLPMAEALEEFGYQLFTYHPWIQQLKPVESAEDLRGVLNIIAVAKNNVPAFLAVMLQ